MRSKYKKPIPEILRDHSLELFAVSTTMGAIAVLVAHVLKAPLKEAFLFGAIHPLTYYAIAIANHRSFLAPHLIHSYQQERLRFITTIACSRFLSMPIAPSLGFSWILFYPVICLSSFLIAKKI
ncbi:MAG: hypothetical protein KDK60_03575 [Chlamydiia bacterium]|nr:hypothetical protein [Chlamydiia bacterium]